MYLSIFYYRINNERLNIEIKCRIVCDLYLYESKIFI